MVKKAEAEKAVRSLATQWFHEVHPGVADPSTVLPSFDDFILWLRFRGYGHFLEFRSTIGLRDNAEMWFDQELRQTWRN